MGKLYHEWYNHNRVMKRRIFVAIEADEHVKSVIAAWRHAHASLPVRWIKPHNLHLTLIPPWYEEPTTAIQALRALPMLSGEWTIAFHRIRSGPDANSPRLIWLEGRTCAQLEALLQNLAGAAESRIRPCQPRAFTPHITIARAKPIDEQPLARCGVDEAVDAAMNVSSYVLMESRLSPKGAEYNVLARFPFDVPRSNPVGTV